MPGRAGETDRRLRVIEAPGFGIVGREVEIRVVNSVGAPARAAGHGLALRNVRQRLKLMHDVAARLEIESGPERFALRILLPL